MKQILLALAAASLTACATNAGTAPAPAERLVDVSGPVVEAKAAPAAFFLLGDPTPEPVVRVPFELRRLAYIEVYLRNDSIANAQFGASPLTTLRPLPNDEPTDVNHEFAPLKLSNLKANTDYSVRLKGFQIVPGQGATAIDVTGANKAASTTAVSTKLVSTTWTDASNEQVVVEGGFKLRLADQDFAGTATGNIEATNGKLKTDAPESVEQPE